MDALDGYSSSDPEDDGESEGAVGDESIPAKTPGVPIPKERYALVHVCIPVSDRRGMATFVQKMMGLSRLALVNYPVKTSFVKHERPYHISLSRPFKVPVSQTPAIFSSLRAALRDEHGGTVKLAYKPIGLLSKNRRRLFVAAPVMDKDKHIVVGLIASVDTALKELNLPTFYEDPKPHMSFASTEATGVQDAFEKNRNMNVSEATKNGKETYFSVDVSAVSCEIGQQQIIIPLKKKI